MDFLGLRRRTLDGAEGPESVFSDDKANVADASRLSAHITQSPLYSIHMRSGSGRRLALT